MSPEHLDEIRRTALRFAERHVAPVAADVDHDAPGFPKAVFGHGLEAGFDRLLLPEDAGGVGLGAAELGALVEAVAETCPGHAMVLGVHACAVDALHDAGADALLGEVLEAGIPVGVSLPIPGPEAGGCQPQLTATPAGESLRVDGRAELAINVGVTGEVIAFAGSAEHGLLALLIPVTPEDVHGRPEATLGLRALPIAELFSDAIHLPPTRVLARGEQATALYGRLLGALGRISAAAAAGVMRQAHRTALGYTAERYQGGKQIIDHSHLQTILGDMGAKCVAAEGALLATAARPDDTRRALAAKITATRAALQCCTDAVQLLGGYGYMRDYGLERAMRDAAVLGLLPVSNHRAELWVATDDKANL